MEEFDKFESFRPTPFDGHIHIDDREHWYKMPVSQTRDSGPLDRSNFRSFLAGLGGEGEFVEVHRFGHWGPGWFEIILVDPAAEEILDKALDMARGLEDYPVLDEEDHSALEYDEFIESWDAWGRREFVEGIAKGLPDYAGEVFDCWGGDNDELVQALYEIAADHVNWLYQSTETGVEINITGLVEVALTNPECRHLIADFVLRERHCLK